MGPVKPPASRLPARGRRVRPAPARMLLHPAGTSRQARMLRRCCCATAVPIAPTAISNWLKTVSSDKKTHMGILGGNDHFERLGVGGARKGVIGLKDMIQLKVMRDQAGRINLF